MNKTRSPHATFYRDAKKIAQELFENGVTEPKTISRHVQVLEGTIKRWIKKGKWITKAETAKNLQEEIETAADEALLQALKRFKTEPQNKDLQSLNSMLKGYLERRKPDRKMLEYILKFQSEVINYCIETGNDVLRKHYQASLLDFSEWLRKKYVRIH